MQFSKVPQHGTVRTNFLRCMIGPQFMKLLFVFPEYEYMTRLAIDLQAFVRCGRSFGFLERGVVQVRANNSPFV